MLRKKHDVSVNHPLRKLFHALVERKFNLALAPTDPRMIQYLSNLLTDFVHMDNIYRLRDVRGRQLKQVAEMLVEGDVLLNAPSFVREREVHRHIGDFTLFWTGVFPEALRSMRGSTRKDHIVDYVAQGKKSYYIASTFNYGEYAETARVLRELSELFEFCVYGLSLVRQEWERMGEASYQLAAENLLQ